MNEREAHQHYAGSALTGILASPIFSAMLVDMNRDKQDDFDGSARELLESLSKISWNIASQMVREGREREMIDP